MTTTAPIKKSYPRSCDELGVCQARGIDQCCTHDCLEGRASELRKLRALRTGNGGEQVAGGLPARVLPADEPPRLGQALKWFSVAVLAVTVAAWLGLAAGYWSTH
jgi:hypothetical protein